MDVYRRGIGFVTETQSAKQGYEDWKDERMRGFIDSFALKEGFFVTNPFNLIYSEDNLLITQSKGINSLRGIQK